MAKQSSKRPPSRSDQLPVNRKMLYAVRDELKADFQGVRHELKVLDHKIDSYHSQVSSQLHQMKLMWEQNLHEQRLMMDHLNTLFDRQDRVEKDMLGLRKEWEDFRK